jgi:hypothetical protein
MVLFFNSKTINNLHKLNINIRNEILIMAINFTRVILFISRQQNIFV